MQHEQATRLEYATTAAVAAWNQVAEVKSPLIGMHQNGVESFREISRYMQEISEATRGAAIAMEGLTRAVVEEHNRSKVRDDG